MIDDPGTVHKNGLMGAAAGCLGIAGREGASRSGLFLSLCALGKGNWNWGQLCKRVFVNG